MKKEISYYEQALLMPKFQSYLLLSLLMDSSEDALESIALEFMESREDRDDIEVGA
jgi:hypothetical protein